MGAESFDRHTAARQFLWTFWPAGRGEPLLLFIIPLDICLKNYNTKKTFNQSIFPPRRITTFNPPIFPPQRITTFNPPIPPGGGRHKWIKNEASFFTYWGATLNQEWSFIFYLWGRQLESKRNADSQNTNSFFSKGSHFESKMKRFMFYIRGCQFESKMKRFIFLNKGTPLWIENEAVHFLNKRVPVWIQNEAIHSFK